MCLSIPSKVVNIDENNMATVETFGVFKNVTLDLVEEDIKVGDYVLIHVGFIMGKISEEDAKISLALYEEIVQKMNDGTIDILDGDMGFEHRLNQ